MSPRPRSLPPGSIPTPRPVSPTGPTIDMIAADGPCFAVQQVGDILGRHRPRRPHRGIARRHDGWTAIDGATFAEVAAADNVQVIRFTRTARYVRYAADLTGGTPSAGLAVLDRRAVEDDVKTGREAGSNREGKRSVRGPVRTGPAFRSQSSGERPRVSGPSPRAPGTRPADAGPFATISETPMLDTLANVKTSLLISGTTDDAVLTRLMDAADDFIADFTGRDFTGGTFTETHAAGHDRGVPAQLPGRCRRQPQGRCSARQFGPETVRDADSFIVHAERGVIESVDGPFLKPRLRSERPLARCAASRLFDPHGRGAAGGDRGVLPAHRPLVSLREDCRRPGLPDAGVSGSTRAASRTGRGASRPANRCRRASCSPATVPRASGVSAGPGHEPCASVSVLPHSGGRHAAIACCRTAVRIQ